MLSSRLATSVPILVYALIGYLLHQTRGHYSLPALIWLTVIFGIFAIAHSKEIEKKAEPWVPILLLTIGLFFVMRTLRDPAIQFGEVHSLFFFLHKCIQGFLVLIFALLIVSLLAPKKFAELKIDTPLAILAVCLLFAARALVLLISPHPHIDTFVTGNLAAQHALSGVNPYTSGYPEIYEGSFGYEPSFNYWPLTLYWMTSFFPALQDVRLAFVFCDLFISLTLFRVARFVGYPSLQAWCWVLAWLSFPVAYRVLELTWNDPIFIFAFLLLVMSLLRGKWKRVAVCLGLLAGSKQYSVFVLIPALIYLYRSVETKKFLKLMGISLAVFAVPFLPFLGSLRSVIHYTIVHLWNQPLREDALAWPAFFSHHGLLIPTPLLVAIYSLVITGLSFLLFRRSASVINLLFSSTLMLLTFFLLGKQAFCNYYYVIAFLVLIYALLRAAPKKY